MYIQMDLTILPLSWLPLILILGWGPCHQLRALGLSVSQSTSAVPSAVPATPWPILGAASALHGLSHLPGVPVSSELLSHLQLGEPYRALLHNCLSTSTCRAAPGPATPGLIFSCLITHCQCDCSSLNLRQSSSLIRDGWQAGTLNFHLVPSRAGKKTACWHRAWHLTRCGDRRVGT